MLKAKKLKKVIALMFIAITLLSTAQPIFAVTDSGSGKWTAGQWDSNIYTTDNKSDLGMLMRRLVNTTTGEKITVFCAEHGVNSQTGTVEIGTHNAPTDPKLKRACKVAFFGWYQKYGNYCIDGGIMAADMNSRKMDYVFTQQMIWSTLGQSSATFRNASIQSQYEAFRADINAKIDNMERKPSFCNETITVEVGQTQTLTDSNNVLGQYVSFDKTIDGIRVTHNKGENTLNVTANEDCTKEAIRISENTMFDWGVIKEETHNQHSTVYFTFRDGVQNQLYSLNYNDPVTMSLSLKINLLGNLELSKLNTNGDLVDGAVFNVTGENGFNRDVTVTNGKIKLEKLRKGTYYIREKSSPTGYLLNTETYTAEVKPNQTTEQAIVNTEPTAEITVTKTNTNGDKVQGAKFQITANEDIYNVAKTVKHHSKGDVVATITTNSVGVAKKSDLPLGKYKIKEIEVPTGYLLNTEQKEVTLRYKDQNTNVIFGSVTVENTEPTGNLVIEKTDKETGNKNRVDKKSHHGDATLKGTEYTLYAKERITNVAGTIKYFDKDEQIATFTFNEYGVASIKITNNNTPAKISVDGTKLTGLPMGKYYAKETIVPTGYMPDTKVYDYTFSYRDMNTKVIEVAGTVTNTVEKAPFEVIKVSTNENATAETVANAEFTAILSKYVDYYGSFDEAKKHLNEFATDEYSIFRTGTNGHGISGLLAYGEYTVNETYTPSPEITTVEQFYVTIDKDSKTPVKELVENDLPFEAYIKMQKQDKKTGKFVTYSNATFELYRLNEDTNKWEQVQCKISDKYYKTWTTNSEGVAKTETKLEAGKYKLTEIKIPTGFIQLDEELTFKVDNRNSTLNYDKDWDAWITVTVKNEQPTGTLKLNKKVALREDMDKTMIKDIDFTKISFELVADEKIIDYADGSTIYEKGKVVGKYNLKADGTLTVSNLPMSKYHLKELTTIDGAVLDKTEYEVIFEQKDTVTKEYVVEKDIENRTTAIEVSKTDITGEKELVGAKLTVTDENNEVIDSWVSTEKTHKIEGLVVGKEYTLKEETAPNGFVVATEIKFRVENTTEIQKVTMIDKVVTMTKQDIGGNEVEGAELQVIDEDNNIVDEWTSTKEPHRINNLVEGKTYTLIEQYAPDGFVISNEIKFTVTTDKETQEVKMIDKVLEISKQDIAGNELEGATLVVTNTKTKNIVDKWVSGKEPHKVNGLIENEEYILHEEIVVDGYVKATDVKFTVTSDKETQKVIMIDKVLEVIKTDLVTGEEIEGAELKVIDEDGNVIDEWTSSKEPHKVVGLEENKTYKLVEITAPYGYEITEEIEFTVSEDKETQRVEMKDMPILQNVKLVKVDSNTKETIKDKFTFGIYEDAECTKLIKEVKSDKEKGTVLFKDLRYGTYYIKEIAAPKGYVLSDKVIKVEMNDKGTFIDNEKVESEDSTYTFEFENVPVDTPKTGDNSNLKLYVGLLGLSILALASVGVHEYKKKKSVNKK